MRHVEHFIAGVRIPGGSDALIYNPSSGMQIAVAAAGGAAQVDAAVAAATKAFSAWSTTGLQYRMSLMLDLRHAVQGAREELRDIVVAELGKTVDDAEAEVDRAIEVLGQAASVASWYGSPFTPGVSRDVDAFEVRYPIGVVAAISPFNFPVLIPVVQSAMAIACGNTVVLKPSEHDPSATVRVAELFTAAGLPPGVLNVLLGGQSAAEGLVRHPGVAGVSFVGSTSVARAVRATGVAHNKRVQAFGGGKNHMVVLPDADLDVAADAAVSAAFGAAGQRCMAVSVVVAVGAVGDPLVVKIRERLAKLRTGDPSVRGVQVGPVISASSRERIVSLLAEAEADGGILFHGDDQAAGSSKGWYVSPHVVDRVRPGAAAHSEEIFGPVLSIVRVESYEEAVETIASHPLGNGAAIFTSNGAMARRFIDQTEAGQIGINVPIPFPVFFHNFGGWRDSAFTETKLFGPGALAFHTRTKTVTSRWPEPATSVVDLGFPMPR